MLLWFWDDSGSPSVGYFHYQKISWDIRLIVLRFRYAWKHLSRLLYFHKSVGKIRLRVDETLSDRWAVNSSQEQSTEPSQGPGKHDCTVTLDCVSGDFCKWMRPPDAEVTADVAASTLFSNVCFNFLNILAPFMRTKITDVYGRSNISQHPPYYACSRHVPRSCALHRKFKCRIRLQNNYKLKAQTGQTLNIEQCLTCVIQKRCQLVVLLNILLSTNCIYCVWNVYATLDVWKKLIQTYCSKSLLII